MESSNTVSNNDLRVIKTARDIESINAAVKAGFRPLVKKVLPSKKIKNKYSVIQNKTTGEITVVGDYRHSIDTDEYEIVVNWTFFYPYKFESPFAAYLVPKDIRIGEIVMLEDLIEDIVGTKWNQGDTYRLESCRAIWNGSDLEIIDSSESLNFMVG